MAARVRAGTRLLPGIWFRRVVLRYLGSGPVLKRAGIAGFRSGNSKKRGHAFGFDVETPGDEIGVGSEPSEAQGEVVRPRKLVPRVAARGRSIGHQALPLPGETSAEERALPLTDGVDIVVPPPLNM